MLDTAAVRKAIKQTFVDIKATTSYDQRGIAFVSAEVLRLEGVIDMLLTQLEKEQERNRALERAIDTFGVRLRDEMLRIVSEGVIR